MTRHRVLDRCGVAPFLQAAMASGSARVIADGSENRQAVPQTTMRRLAGASDVVGFARDVVAPVRRGHVRGGTDGSASSSGGGTGATGSAAWLFQ